MTSTQLPTLISSPLNILTLQDVILDSPVFRSNIEQVADQADLFEKWLDGFVRVLKVYIDSLSKTNAQTSILCKHLIPEKNDYNFICNSQIAGQVINGFASALETGLSAKAKLVNDLDESLLQPLQHLLKTDLKEFKEMRKIFEKSLDKYENHLSRYSNLSKQKEPSSLREDAFQMFDVQKTYVHASGTYFMQLISVKSEVEHLLVDCFSDGLSEHLDHLNDSLQSQTSARSMIPGWRQWLNESKATCAIQLQRIEESTRALEDAHIRQLRPHRSLKRYSTSNNDQMVAITNSSTFESLSDDGNDNIDASATHSKMSSSSTSLPSTASAGEVVDTPQPIKSSSSTSSLLSDSSLHSPTSRYVKQGYLFSRIVVGKPSRYSWVRRWFFLKDGWFGQYTVSTVNKVKGTLTINDRIPTDASCECRIFTDIDRRFCFEVTDSGTSFFLQAETEQDMQQWLWAIEKAKELHGKDDSTGATHDLDIPRALLAPKANMTIQKPAHDPSQLLVSLSVSPPIIQPSKDKILNTKPIAQATDYLVNDLSTVSTLTTLMIREGNATTDTTANNTETDSDDKDSTITTSDSTTPLNQAVIVHGDDKSNDDTANTQSQDQQQSSADRQSSTWSMPWLMSGINALSSSTGNTQGEPNTVVVWPNKVELSAPQVKLDGYSDDLLAGQRELRRYFACVPEDNIVMDVFSASLYRQSKHNSNSSNDNEGSSSDDNAKGGASDQNTKSLGEGYSGTVYMTQKSLWFYSCRMMTCLNAVVIPYGSIKTIRLEKILSANSQGMLMYIDTKANPTTAYCFGVWLDSAELIAERLRVVTENAKRSIKMDDQVLFDIIRCTTIGKIRSKTPTSQVIAITTSNTAVTPLTVQAQSRLTTESQKILDHLDSDENKSPSPSVSSSLSDTSHPGTTKPTVERQHNSSPAAGALTAAMEAANESRSAESEPKPPRKGKQNKHQGGGDKGTSVGTAPSKPVECKCDDHLDKTEADLELPASARQIYEYLTGLSCWEQLNKVKGNSVPCASKWKSVNTTMERILSYTMPSPMARGKEAEVIETQQVLRKDNGLCYVVLVTTKTPTLPYADAFIPMIKFCITYNSPTTCRMVCSIGVKWLKSIMVKGMVNRAAVKGMCETITALTPVVKQAAAQAKGGGDFEKQHLAVNEKEGSAKLPPSDQASSDTQGQQGDTKRTVEIGKWNILGNTTLSPPWLFVISVSVALLLLLYPTWLFARAGLPLSSMDVVSTLHPSSYMTNITWRAVHLSDLEPLFDGKDTEANRTNSSAYQAFKSSRPDIGVWDYRWFSIRHRLTAAELTFTREQLAVIRYELLMAFKMLNGMEQRLLESEYWNWLLDKKSRCDLGPLDNQYNEDNTSATLSLCNEINAELGHS